MKTRYNRLYIFVEGVNDIRFFDRIIKPLFEKEYDWVALYEYASQTRKKVSDFIRCIRAAKADYIFVNDLHSSPCVRKRKARARHKHSDLESDKIIIVKTEIESWYLAGLTKAEAKDLGISGLPSSTDKLTKSQFQDLRPKKFDTEIDFRLEVLKRFSIRAAKSKNSSFRYFHEKLIKR